MNLIESIYASGKVMYLILFPVLREISAVLLAVAIAKDCKARNNGSSALWGVFTLFTPTLSGIIYFIYSRLLVKRKAKNPNAKKKAKSAYKLTAAAIAIYILSLIFAVVAIVASYASQITLSSEYDNIKEEFMPSFTEEYYDRDGVKYDNGEDVILYDKNGNQYHYDLSPDGFNYYTYFDQNGNEYNIEYCYISSDGYFYYDYDNQLKDSDDLWYYDKHFYDSNGNEYAHIDNYAFWDKDGNIYIQYSGTKCRYAFE